MVGGRWLSVLLLTALKRLAVFGLMGALAGWLAELIDIGIDIYLYVTSLKAILHYIHHVEDE